jgi:endonuclease YncB( thermonuclease family)
MTLRQARMTSIGFVACLLACSLAQAADLSGVPRIIDGDTLAIGATKVRLEGIDAPETVRFASTQKVLIGLAASTPVTSLQRI